MAKLRKFARHFVRSGVSKFVPYVGILTDEYTKV